MADHEEKRISKKMAARPVTVLLTMWCLHILLPNASFAASNLHCTYPGLKLIEADPIERSVVCDALTDVVTYFRQAGFSFEPNVSIWFKDSASETSRHPSSAHGYFDAARSRIVMFRTTSSRPWNLDYDGAIAKSFLLHELVHSIAMEIVQDRSDQIPPEWHEFIAYAVQFALMDAALRKRLLKNNAAVNSFHSLSAVNEFTHRMNPDAFSIAAYKTYFENGGVTYIEKILRFKIKVPPMVYPFEIRPEQMPNQ